MKNEDSGGTSTGFHNYYGIYVTDESIDGAPDDVGGGRLHRKRAHRH